MIKTLRLIDFMAHADTTLELAPGLNVLTGPNNTGKSAVVEALRCLVQNPVPHHVIRHGASEARVVVTFDDGTTIAWVRRPRYALYKLTRPGAAEPEVFAKFGRTPPEAILDVLRLDLVPLDAGQSVDVHVGNQREPVFLLNQPGTVVAGFFAASSEAAHLLAMQHRLTDRTRRAKTEGRRLETRLTSIAASLDRLAPLPDLERRLRAVDDLEADLAVLGREMPALAGWLDRERRMRRQLAGLTRSGRVLAGLTPPPALVPTAALVALLVQRRMVLQDMDHTGARQKILSRLAGPPSLMPTSPLTRAAAALAATRRALACGQTRGRVLAALREPPQLADLVELGRTMRRLVAIRGETAGLAARVRGLTALAPPSEITPLENLAETTRSLAAVRTALAAKEAELAARTRALEAAEARIAARLTVLGVCPLCGARLSTAAFLGREQSAEAKELP